MFVHKSGYETSSLLPPSHKQKAEVRVMALQVLRAKLEKYLLLYEVCADTFNPLIDLLCLFNLLVPLHCVHFTL